jgi:hypothetical protein
MAGSLTSFQEPSRNDSLAVGVSSIKVSDRRPDQMPRKSFAIRNISPNAADIISLTFGLETAVANEGIVLYQYEIYQESSESDNPCFQGSITAICATANGLLAISER